MTRARGGPCIAVALLATLAAAAAAVPAGSGALSVSGAYARATPPGATTGAIYLTVVNSGAQAERLVGARCDAAGSVMVHATQLVGGVLQMREGDLRVPAHGSAVLAPQGAHLMLMDLKHALVAGGHVQLTLRFAPAGEMRVDVPVRPVAAAP